MSSYGYSKTLTGDFQEIVARVTEALKEEGFGVLTTIDVKDKFKEKLNVEVDDYMILGACNPGQAHKAIQVEKEIGLLLPCNVLVYKDGDQVTVAAMRPAAAMQFIGNASLDTIAAEVEVSLKRVVDSL